MFTIIMILLILALIAFAALLVGTGLTVIYYAVPVLMALFFIGIGVRMIKKWFK